MSKNPRASREKTGHLDGPSALPKAAPRVQDLPDEDEVQRIILESERVIQEVPGELSDSFARYLHELQRYPVLSPEREHELAVQAQRGSLEAREALVRHNLRFVVTVARKYQVRGVLLEDLVQEGNIGLLRAVTRFRPEFGVRFISYGVHWIRQSIRAFLAYQQGPARLPINRATQLARIYKVANALSEKLGRAPTAEEVANSADVPLDIVSTLLQVSQGEVSLDASQAKDDSGVRLSERLANGSDLDLALERWCRHRHVESAIGQLRERDALVLRLFFGLDGSREHTLEEIGRVLGVTRERVRQIRDRALRELRNRHGAALRDYIGTHYPDDST